MTRNAFFLLLAPFLAKVEGMRKAGNLGKFLRTFTSGFTRLPAACSVRFAGKGGSAKNENYFNDERNILRYQIRISVPEPEFLGLLDPDPDP
jgi:hypothetical protein